MLLVFERLFRGRDALQWSAREHRWDTQTSTGCSPVPTSSPTSPADSSVTQLRPPGAIRERSPTFCGSSGPSHDGGGADGRQWQVDRREPRYQSPRPRGSSPTPCASTNTLRPGGLIRGTHLACVRMAGCPARLFRHGGPQVLPARDCAALALRHAPEDRPRDDTHYCPRPVRRCLNALGYCLKSSSQAQMCRDISRAVTPKISVSHITPLASA